ncbi:hypothetical protein Airi02_103270 [Actinoallomurus iriomotensis]|uniref:Uncharacterized protein n=1 Tax=Actinoallomurus iriomotensis TaxID=478107 RepID=A0A9W6SF23_9ACTN|nr:hypothetical protein Airi02_103270 [Actinoallomurus iriomotensis]
MRRTQLDEDGGAAAEGARNSGERPQRAQRAGVVHAMQGGHHHRRGGHAAYAQGYAECAVTRGGEHTAEYVGRPSSGSGRDRVPPCHVQTFALPMVLLCACGPVYRNMPGAGQVNTKPDLRT